MAAWNSGKVVEHRQWSQTLYSLYVESDIEAFEAGQFVKIALEINGEVIGRPYSLVNPPDCRPLEFYYIEVPNGPLTSHLIKLIPGDNILVAPRAHGFMVLDEVPQAKQLWLMATGTGIGPFLSILMTDKPWQRYEQVVLVYAVRTLSELSYQERITQILTKHSGQFGFIPFLSREALDFALPGRIPQAIIDGRLEARAGIKISAENSQIMLCGNPQMVKDITNILIERGLRKHRRFEPGQITSENYWQG
ncbi:MAG TPA: ferredoxin--NADP reductase [Methylophilaceae bacterium]|nr:ferredoxin--NADP reductase [Methylophilaceae bacterium]